MICARIDIIVEHSERTKCISVEVSVDEFNYANSVLDVKRMEHEENNRGSSCLLVLSAFNYWALKSYSKFTAELNKLNINVQDVLLTTNEMEYLLLRVELLSKCILFSFRNCWIRPNYTKLNQIST